MGRSMVVRYRPRPDAADENQRLVSAEATPIGSYRVFDNHH